MKQNHEIRFKVDKTQHDKIKQRAEEVGMTIKSFVLHLVLTTRIKVMVE